jgi:hypothetical protein
MTRVVDIATFSRKPGMQYRLQVQYISQTPAQPALIRRTSAFADISGESKSP